MKLSQQIEAAMGKAAAACAKKRITDPAQIRDAMLAARARVVARARRAEALTSKLRSKGKGAA